MATSFIVKWYQELHKLIHIILVHFVILPPVVAFYHVIQSLFLPWDGKLILRFN